MRKELGKIKSIDIHLEDGLLGMVAVLSGVGWRVDTSATKRFEWSKNCQWTIQDRNKTFVEIWARIHQLLADAKCRYLSDLVGVPIEAEFDGNLLKSWRILTEVL